MKVICDRLAIGDRIKRLREEMNITCEELAERLGEEKGYFAEIEQGKKGMSLRTALELASFFDVTLDYLTYGEEESVLAERMKRTTGKEV